MLVATILAWVSWVLVISIINPTQAAWWGFFFFYVTLFLALFGSFGVAGLAIRLTVAHRQLTVSRDASMSLRQAFLWSLALVVPLALQAQRLLTWWVFILLILTFTVVEFFILSIHRVADDEM